MKAEDLMDALNNVKDGYVKKAGKEGGLEGMSAPALQRRAASGESQAVHQENSRERKRKQIWSLAAACLVLAVLSGGTWLLCTRVLLPGNNAGMPGTPPASGQVAGNTTNEREGLAETTTEAVPVSFGQEFELCGVTVTYTLAEYVNDIRDELDVKLDDRGLSSYSNRHDQTEVEKILSKDPTSVMAENHRYDANAELLSTLTAETLDVLVYEYLPLGPDDIGTQYLYLTQNELGQWRIFDSIVLKRGASQSSEDEEEALRWYNENMVYEPSSRMPDKIVSDAKVKLETNPAIEAIHVLRTKSSQGDPTGILAQGLTDEIAVQYGYDSLESLLAADNSYYEIEVVHQLDFAPSMNSVHVTIRQTIYFLRKGSQWVVFKAPAELGTESLNR